jgi:hypothetical protein
MWIRGWKVHNTFFSFFSSYFSFSLLFYFFLLIIPFSPSLISTGHERPYPFPSPLLPAAARTPSPAPSPAASGRVAIEPPSRRHRAPPYRGLAVNHGGSPVGARGAAMEAARSKLAGPPWRRLAPSSLSIGHLPISLRRIELLWLLPRAPGAVPAAGLLPPSPASCLATPASPASSASSSNSPRSSSFAGERVGLSGILLVVTPNYRGNLVT